MERGWFQIHLSTALLITVLAGVLLWLNIRPQYIIVSTDIAPKLYESNVEKRGWPEVALEKVRFFCEISFPYGRDGAKAVKSSPVESDFSPLKASGIIVNVIIAAALIVTAVVFSEYMIRRREARKP